MKRTLNAACPVYQLKKIEKKRALEEKLKEIARKKKKKNKKKKSKA